MKFKKRASITFVLYKNLCNTSGVTFIDVTSYACNCS